MAKKKEETQEAETEVVQEEFEVAQSENVEVLNSEASQPVKGKKRIQISVYLSPESYTIAKKLEPVTRKSISETISDWVDIYADMNTEASKEADKISAMLGRDRKSTV